MKPKLILTVTITEEGNQLNNFLEGTGTDRMSAMATALQNLVDQAAPIIGAKIGPMTGCQSEKLSDINMPVNAHPERS